ncbi:MAG TPA: hypothetical protein VFB72_15995 [Verrucomicrobiae bacterium]|nr:hypothetical protein [Verrucomicrobiae bacterium]
MDCSAIEKFEYFFRWFPVRRMQFMFFAPLARTHSKTLRKHKVEQAQRFVSAFQRHIDNFRIGCSEQFPRAGQAEFRPFVAKGHSCEFVKNPAQVPRRAMRPLRQLAEIHFQ